MADTVADHHRSVGARIRAQRHQPLDVPLPDRVVHRRIRLRIGCRPGQARALLRRGTGDLPHRVGADQRARRLLPAPRGEHGGRRHRRGRTHRLPVARLALERRRHQRPDPVQQDRLQAERPHQDLPGRGVVRLHPGVARAPWPRAVLAAAGAARTGDRRVLPAAPAHPDGEPGQGARADDHRERRRPVPRAVCAQGGQPREHRLVRGQRLPPARAP